MLFNFLEVVNNKPEYDRETYLSPEFAFSVLRVFLVFGVAKVGLVNVCHEFGHKCFS